MPFLTIVTYFAPLESREVCSIIATALCIVMQQEHVMELIITHLEPRHSLLRQEYVGVPLEKKAQSKIKDETPSNFFLALWNVFREYTNHVRNQVVANFDVLTLSPYGSFMPQAHPITIFLRDFSSLTHDIHSLKKCKKIQRSRFSFTQTWLILLYMSWTMSYFFCPSHRASQNILKAFLNVKDKIWVSGPGVQKRARHINLLV